MQHQISYYLSWHLYYFELQNSCLHDENYTTRFRHGYLETEYLGS
uniref:Uncharacterized protein n=1 Tax=Rhizophora mucronata TaxID=61149 RepID=A0A2P2Q7W9_RHIMU